MGIEHFPKKMVKGPVGPSEEWLRALGFLAGEEETLRSVLSSRGPALLSLLWGPLTAPGAMAGAGLRRFRLDIRKRFFPQRVQGTAQAALGMGPAPELQERLDTAPRHRLGVLGCPGHDQEFDLMILVAPVQFGAL